MNPDGFRAKILVFPCPTTIPPASRQPSRRRRMGVWIEVEEGEPIADALRRFRKLIRAEGAFPLNHCKWHKKRNDLYLKPSVLNRRRRWIIRVRKRGCVTYNPDPDNDWANDIETMPRRAWGPMGRFVVT